MIRLYAAASIAFLIVAALLIWRAAPPDGAVVIREQRVVWASPVVVDRVREIVREVTVAPPTWTPFPTPAPFVWPTPTPVLDFSGAVSIGDPAECTAMDQYRGSC